MESLDELKAAYAEGKITFDEYAKRVEEVARSRYETPQADRDRRQRIEDGKSVDWRSLKDDEFEEREDQLRRDLSVERTVQERGPSRRVVIDVALLSDEQFSALERAVHGRANATDYKTLEAAGAIIEEK